MLVVGDDWAEDHHDIEIQDQAGRRLAKARLAEGVEGLAGLHALIGQFLDPDADAGQVAVAVETDRGLWVQALGAAGYQVYAINPLQAARARGRGGVSGARATPLTPTAWPIWYGPIITSSGSWRATASWPGRSR